VSDAGEERDDEVDEAPGVEEWIADESQAEEVADGTGAKGVAAWSRCCPTPELLIGVGRRRGGLVTDSAVRVRQRARTAPYRTTVFPSLEHSVAAVRHAAPSIWREPAGPR
jgi:hypothetical protein